MSRPVCLVIDYVFPPIPVRSFDWAVWIDGREESGPYGRGPTREAAINDLFEQLAIDDLFEQLEEEAPNGSRQ